MRTFYRTTALAAALGALSFGAAAQDNTSSKLASGDYCDTMWNQVDTDNDGFVSKQEAQDDLELRFSAIDEDGDGNITRVEYIDCQTGTPVMAPVERDEETFRSADTDTDEQLDRNEFAAAAQSAFDDAQSEQGENRYKSFDSYTWLSEDEASDREAAIGDMSADEAAFRASVNFNALDENNDDVLTVEEWKARDVAPRHDEAWAETRFDRLDSNGSGAINKDEFEQARTEMVDQMTTAATFQDDVKDEGENAAEASSSTDGTSVYIYHFSFW